MLLGDPICYFMNFGGFMTSHPFILCEDYSDFASSRPLTNWEPRVPFGRTYNYTDM